MFAKGEKKEGKPQANMFNKIAAMQKNNKLAAQGDKRTNDRQALTDNLADIRAMLDKDKNKKKEDDGESSEEEDPFKMKILKILKIENSKKFRITDLVSDNLDAFMRVAFIFIFLLYLIIVGA